MLLSIDEDGLAADNLARWDRFPAWNPGKHRHTRGQTNRSLNSHVIILMMQSPSRARHENSRLYHSHDDVWLRSKCRFRVEKKKRAVCWLENSCQTVSLNYRVITHSPSTHNRRRLLEEIWMNKERVKKLCYTRRCFVRQRIGRMSEWEIGLSCCCGLDYTMQTWKSRLGFMEIMISFEFDIIPWENIGDSAPTRVHD